ncbi:MULTISPECIES: pyridoxamine 5'-phosphate oxidase family protein [Haloferacaceae]|uniref:Pyridoxamine 5'-phosphate oxidase family protein n=1 Tax=Halorubrum glutamatedens TaxID=2707018 RepID=A0ABD5QML6_9EURY|nr:pyridoxamine 5'-phosphate oxidase family protein [Halobellus captivus]
MGDIDAVRMDDDERDEFLGRSGTGVISLATAGDEPPHSVPVSYGYDPMESVLYFRLSVGPDRTKGELDDREATFVTYGEDDGRWRSVVASGRLVSTTDESVAEETIQGLERTGRIPIVDVFGEPTSEVTFAFYRLDPDRITTRVERPMDP